MTQAPQLANRLAYIDWMRGLACVLMFQTHCYNSWLAPEARKSALYAWSQLGGTLPAPLFIFLSGISSSIGHREAPRKRRGPQCRREKINSSWSGNLRPGHPVPHPGIRSGLPHLAVDRPVPRRHPEHPRYFHDVDGRAVLADLVRCARARFNQPELRLERDTLPFGAAEQCQEHSRLPHSWSWSRRCSGRPTG